MTPSDFSRETTESLLSPPLTTNIDTSLAGVEKYIPAKATEATIAKADPVKMTMRRRRGNEWGSFNRIDFPKVLPITTRRFCKIRLLYQTINTYPKYVRNFVAYDKPRIPIFASFDVERAHHGIKAFCTPKAPPCDGAFGAESMDPAGFEPATPRLTIRVFYQLALRARSPRLGAKTKVHPPLFMESGSFVSTKDSSVGGRHPDRCIPSSVPHPVKRTYPRYAARFSEILDAGTGIFSYAGARSSRRGALLTDFSSPILRSIA